MDDDMETELMDHCNCTICMWWICCNDYDYWPWLVGIAC